MKLKIFLLVFFFPLWLNASRSSMEPAQSLTISGTVTDSASGEKLAGVTIFVKEINNGTATNAYGFYSLSLKPGTYHIKYSFIGYHEVEKEVRLVKSLRLNIKMKSTSKVLQGVEIKARSKSENVSSTEMSVVKVDIKTVKKIPALMGEVDILKTIQLLPGVLSTGEGGTGFSVRGGGTDQNLILMDEAQVFNASHLMGFFSVFNNDAVKDLKLYKGDIPAAYGGRLSSLLDVHQKEGNNRVFKTTGGIGLISSRLMLEGPLKKEKASFLVAGRRSYADIFLPLAPNQEIRDNKLYFYDLNMKVNYDINENNRIFFSGYLGRDVFKVTQNGGFGMDWGNNTYTLRWNHIFSQKIFTNFTLLRSDYNYKMESDDPVQNFIWKSRMTNYTFKADNGYFLNMNNKIKFGVFGRFHHFYPGSITGKTSDSPLNETTLPESQALEYGLYGQNTWKINASLTVDYGLRFTMFQNIGPATVYNYDENYHALDSTVYEKREIYNSWSGLEPRAGLTFLINSKSSVKASYSRTMQFVQLASNSTVGNPFSIWFPASPNVKPQYADQVAVGYFRNFKNDAIETSVEVFYKKMYNQIDFKDHARLVMNPRLEGELRFGEGEAYGVEILVRKNFGKLTGWISYTYSKSIRYFDDINNGNPYLSPFDKPHDFSFVVSYDFSKRINASATWVYSSGSPATFPSGRFTYGNMIAPVYTDRNDFRLPDYHRLDLGVTIKEKPKPGRKWHHSWVFSVYNAYDRHNAYSISFEPSKDDPNKTVAVKTYLFGVIPSITFNFDF